MYKLKALLLLPLLAMGACVPFAYDPGPVYAQADVAPAYVAPVYVRPAVVEPAYYAPRPAGVVVEAPRVRARPPAVVIAAPSSRGPGAPHRGWHRR